ncbi:MAG: AAA family ATPase, partial [Bacteroides sp.]|nr:AAA family ATPase [Bacteroides sp.]
QTGLQQGEIDRYYNEKMRAIYLPANVLQNNGMQDHFSEIVKHQQKKYIVEQLQKFDEHITGVELLADGIYLGYDNMQELMPLSMAGEGIRHFLSIILAAASGGYKVVLIDEIDNGLHYSAYPLLWKCLFGLAQKQGVQLFITTHSKEVLARLVEMLDENVEYSDLLSAYTIENTKMKGHQAYRYPYEALKNALNNDMEVRGLSL